MILVDVNLLVYAYLSNSSQHETSRAWLEERFYSGDRVGLPWPSLLGFVRIVVNPRVSRPSPPVSEAWAQVRRWLAWDTTWIPQPTERHADVLESILAVVGGGGPKVIPDAHLAALAIEHGLTLASADMGFRAYPHLRWINPLAA